MAANDCTRVLMVLLGTTRSTRKVLFSAEVLKETSGSLLAWLGGVAGMPPPMAALIIMFTKGIT